MLLPVSRAFRMSIECLVKRRARLNDVFLTWRNELRWQKDISAMLGFELGLSVGSYGITSSNAMRFKQTKCNRSVQSF